MNREKMRKRAMFLANAAEDVKTLGYRLGAALGSGYDPDPVDLKELELALVMLNAAHAAMITYGELPNPLKDGLWAVVIEKGLLNDEVRK